MLVEFSTIHNHHERAVFDAVLAAAPKFPALGTPDLLADVACVALNRLPSRYIRHDVDYSFYQTDKERAESGRAVERAVAFAFEFVQARCLMRARDN